MTIPAIAAISSLPSFSTAGVGATTATGASGTAATSGTDFASALGRGLDQVQGLQNNADSLAVQAATGDLTDISSYTIAATQASVATQLLSTVRTQGVNAFNQIMGMQA
jgi:flagellar hook-basal body complex protein FliE